MMETVARTYCVGTQRDQRGGISGSADVLVGSSHLPADGDVGAPRLRQACW